MQVSFEIRSEREHEAPLVAAVTREAFGPEDEVVARLPAALTAHHLERKGVGAALVAAALRAADEAGEPFVMLEGAPGLYRLWGFEPAADHGLSPPSARIPAPACQVALLGSWDPSVKGALVYNDVFWTHDAVGLRGAVLEQVRSALGR